MIHLAALILSTVVVGIAGLLVLWGAVAIVSVPCIWLSEIGRQRDAARALAARG